MINQINPECRLCRESDETSWHLLYDCPSLESKRREFMFSPDNPKTGPDIDWYIKLARHLKIFDWLMQLNPIALE